MSSGFTADRSPGDVGAELLVLPQLSAGGSRRCDWAGTEALMLAVLQDGIRTFLSRRLAERAEAEYWVHSQAGRSPFSFIVVCQTLGLDPSAVRTALLRMRDRRVGPREAVCRLRPNARRPQTIRSRRVASPGV